jgi:hypothetical protein
MNEAGYDWDGERRRCGDAPNATNPAVYHLPIHSMDRTITNIQLSFE